MTMHDQPYMNPLPKAKRRGFFWALLFLFVAVIPFLYLYATGYRFSWKEQMNFISTGGLFIAADETGVEIYIDDELVRETRVFRKAFYAQNIDPGTHRVHVQKEGFHTWVKELPVYPHLVTEVSAFNLPLVPRVRPITRYETATGTPLYLIAKGGTIPVLQASTTEEIVATTTRATSTLVASQEYVDLLRIFEKEEIATSSKNRGVVKRIETTLEQVGVVATSTPDVSTTTKEYNNVRLFERGDDIVAAWVGAREGMPYYYCAEAFDPLPPKETSTLSQEAGLIRTALSKEEREAMETLLNPPVQKVEEGDECVPEITLDRKGQVIQEFDFFPGSSDLAVLTLPQGVYAVEIDGRGWQNMQPVFLGEGLSARVYNGHIVVFDGTIFYEVLYE